MTTAPQAEPREPATAAEAAGWAPSPAPRRSWAWLGIAGWVAAAAMAVSVATFWETILRLRNEVTIRDERAAELLHRLARDQRWITVVSAPGARITELRPASAPSEHTSALRGSAVYDPGSQRVLVVFEEAKPPSGRDYRLWALRGGVPMDLGIVRPDSAGVAIYRLENMGAPGITEGFLVSLEPAGGAQGHAAPTGPTVLQGSIAN
jgi:anti-sigma-K factor RskA